jgi:hypothetical protein
MILGKKKDPSLKMGPSDTALTVLTVQTVLTNRTLTYLGLASAIIFWISFPAHSAAFFGSSFFNVTL